MSEEGERLLTTGEFAKALWQAFCGDEEQTFAIGVRHGWLNAQDELEADRPIRRNAAARILHEFLLRELGEKDLGDTRMAMELKDLYDCRTCVNHVAQVYCRGIMPAYREKVFGMREGITGAEAKEILRRLFCMERTGGAWRVKEGQHRLGKEQVRDFLREHPDAVHVDVRTRWEYDNWHPEGAVNIPLLQLMERPGSLGFGSPAFILLGCDGGYRSGTAAACLEAEGYQHVFYYGFEEIKDHRQMAEQERKNGGNGDAPGDRGPIT